MLFNLTQQATDRHLPYKQQNQISLAVITRRILLSFSESTFENFLGNVCTRRETAREFERMAKKTQ